MTEATRDSSAAKAGGPEASVGGWRIREARPADLPDLARIEAKSYSAPWSPESFAVLGANESVRILVAERSEAERGSPLVGYAVFWVAGGDAELANLAVDPAMRRRGLGRALLDRAIAIAKEAEAETFHLDVRVSNAAALTLYRSRGFRRMSIRAQYYAHPTEDAEVMRLDLSRGDDA